MQGHSPDYCATETILRGGLSVFFERFYWCGYQRRFSVSSKSWVWDLGFLEVPWCCQNCGPADHLSCKEKLHSYHWGALRKSRLPCFYLWNSLTSLVYGGSRHLEFLNPLQATLSLQPPKMSWNLASILGKGDYSAERKNSMWEKTRVYGSKWCVQGIGCHLFEVMAGAKDRRWWEKKPAGPIITVFSKDTHFKDYFIFLITCMCVVHMYMRPEASDYPGAGIIGGYELLHVGTGNQTLVLCKTYKHPSPLNRLPRPF